MVQRIARCLLAACAVLLMGSFPGVMATEIVHFVNGSSMPVLGHKIEKGTITLELSPGATIAFPAENVERIENNGRAVWTPAATGNNANRATSGERGGGTMASTSGGDFSSSPAARRRERFLSNPGEAIANSAEMASEGAIGRPVAGNPGRRLKRMSGPGAPRLDDPADVQRMGDRLVIPPPNSPTSQKGQPIMGFGPKAAIPPPNPSDQPGAPAVPEDNPAPPGDGSTEVPADDLPDDSSGDQ